ncbi:hypothetical protein [uncultured Bacteroides sp.]|uniref:hypothetical protein n=1 Tax=uncultured Bacteroides sp. TaxID=162156 RepID=UPI0026769BA3|nr:hypothetical protein [uncultured Bacteroides sp.]
MDFIIDKWIGRKEWMITVLSSYCFLSQDDEYECLLLDKEHKIRQFGNYPI